MELKEFIEEFVEPNTLIRLLYKIKGGHKEVCGDNPKMEWELKNSEYANKKVIGVTDIVYRQSHFPEAVNIVIE